MEIIVENERFVNTLQSALEYHRQGIAVVPFAPKSKAPAAGERWKPYQHTPQSQKEVELLFDGREDANIAAIGGAPSDNAFMLELETQRQFDEMGRRLAGLGIDTWVMQRDMFTDGDPHAGGGHYWLKAPVPVASKHVNGWEVRGQGNIVLAPPSTHPTGAHYRFIHQPSAIFRLPSLDAIPGLVLEPAQPEQQRRAIPNLAWKILTGDQETLRRYVEPNEAKRYGYDRSDAECALCCSLIRAGFGFDEVLTLLLRFEGPGKFTELYQVNPNKALAYLRLTYQNAKAYVDATGANATEKLALNLLTWANERQWTGRGRHTDKAVYIAHLEIVRHCGRDPHGASARELAELSGTSWRTAVNANHRLTDGGLLSLETPATVTCSHVWQLLIPPEAVTYLHTPTTRHDGVCKYVTAGGDNASMRDHDVFRWAGLNKTGHDVWQALNAVERATPAELALASGVSTRTVYRKLAAMQEAFMAESMGDGTWRALDVNLDAAAQVLGVAGLGKRQRQQHRQDRRLHRLVLKRGLN